MSTFQSYPKSLRYFTHRFLIKHEPLGIPLSLQRTNRTKRKEATFEERHKRISQAPQPHHQALTKFQQQRLRKKERKRTAREHQRIYIVYMNNRVTR